MLLFTSYWFPLYILGGVLPIVTTLGWESSGSKLAPEPRKWLLLVMIVGRCASAVALVID